MKFAGGGEGYWIAVYRFAETLGITFDARTSARLAALQVYATTCGPLYPYGKVAFVSRRPTTLEFDVEKRLHCETGPAMAFGDDYSLCAWHGQLVPSHWITDKKNVKPSEVLDTRDSNLRAAGISILGWARIVTELGATVVNQHPEGPSGGTLLAVDRSRLNDSQGGVMKFLKADCPRNGTICFRVPDSILTAHAAQAWARGLPPEMFQLPSVRT